MTVVSSFAAMAVVAFIGVVLGLPEPVQVGASLITGGLVLMVGGIVYG